jgi:hypothetical protein
MTPEEIAAAEAAKAKETEGAKIAAEVKAKADAEATAKAAEDETFDKDRAMQTIQKLREIEKQGKKEKAELEQLKAEKASREEAEMTESQKATKRAEDAEAKASKLETDILRRDVIAETGLPALFADRLKGTTKEEMLADAQELAKTLPQLKIAPHVPPTNPNNANTQETNAAKRERLFGKQGNPFDMETIKAQGGGVVWNK